MPLQRINSAESIDTSAAITDGGAVSSDNANNAVMQSPGAISNANTTNTNTSTSSNKTIKTDHVNYLTSYEGMVRHQDMEFDATSGHVKAIFERIQTLGCRKNIDGERTIDNAAPRGMLTYLQIRRCLLRMGIGWNRSLPASVTSDDDYDEYYGYDDDVSVLSLSSANSSLNSNGNGGDKSDIIGTDMQLIMLLATLVEMEEKYRADKTTKGRAQSGSGSNNGRYQLDRGLFLPEFTQVYKIIIGGMQSLKSIPNPGEHMRLMDRLKERTLGMLRPFGPHFDMYDTSSSSSSKTLKRENSHDALSSNKYSLRSNYMSGNNNNNNSANNKKSKSSMSDVDMKLVSSKDHELAKILEDHELEMDALASNMHQLRLEEQLTRMALKTKRKRARYMIMFLGGICIAAGVFAEMRRRKFRANELALGREAERRTEKESIAKLKEGKRELEKKLGVMEGKMRYQINRNNDLEAQTQRVEKEIDDVNVEWMFEKAELERCTAAQAEMKGELQREQSKEEGIEEELTWCNGRLRSQERKLNDLQTVDFDDKSRGVVAEIRGNVVAEQSDGGDNETTTSAVSDKPVYLEMKYNKSIRNSMILRQVYSAAAGFAVSALIQGLVPVAIGFFAPKAVAVPLPAAVSRWKNRNAEMIVVDGIFGSSVVFLLIQAVATFLSPL